MYWILIRQCRRFEVPDLKLKTLHGLFQHQGFVSCPNDSIMLSDHIPTKHLGMFMCVCEDLRMEIVANV